MVVFMITSVLCVEKLKENNKRLYLFNILEGMKENWESKRKLKGLGTSLQPSNWDRFLSSNCKRRNTMTPTGHREKQKTVDLY